MTPAAAREILEHALRWADSHKQLVVKIDVEDAREIAAALDRSARASAHPIGTIDG